MTPPGPMHHPDPTGAAYGLATGLAYILRRSPYTGDLRGGDWFCSLYMGNLHGADWSA